MIADIPALAQRPAWQALAPHCIKQIGVALNEQANTEFTILIHEG